MKMMIMMIAHLVSRPVFRLTEGGETQGSLESHVSHLVRTGQGTLGVSNLLGNILIKNN